jgi:hypothetical protein
MYSDLTADDKDKAEYEEMVTSLIKECIWAPKDSRCGVLLLADIRTGLLGVIALNSTHSQVDMIISAAAQGNIGKPKNEKELH